MIWMEHTCTKFCKVRRIEYKFGSELGVKHRTILLFR